MPFKFTYWVEGIFKSEIPTSYLVAAYVGFAIVVRPICPVVAMILLEIGMNGITLYVNILAGISNNSSTLLIRQRLVTI